MAEVMAMLRSVFYKTLRDQYRPLLWWGSSLIALALMVALFYPSIQAMPGFNAMIESAPEALMRAFVGDITDITSPEGYLNSQLFFFLVPLLLLIYAIGFGSAAIAGEEEQGTLDLLLANPLPRWRVVIDKFYAMVVATLALALCFWLGLVGGALAVQMEIGVGQITAATLSAVLLALVFGTLALALGCATGKRGLSAGVASGVAVAAYFLNAFAPLVEGLAPYRKLSPFYTYIGGDPLTNGLNWVHVIVLLGLTLVLLIVARITFDRRDLGV
jgi:ABC-2 type transport system permease protein